VFTPHKTENFTSKNRQSKARFSYQLFTAGIFMYFTNIFYSHIRTDIF
jgi:hypothetical protein